MATGGYSRDPLQTFLNTTTSGVLGALDGLVSVASLLLEYDVLAAVAYEAHVKSAFDSRLKAEALQVLAGIAGMVGGGLSMAAGEWVSVSSQRDSEMADVEKERKEQAKGPAAQAHELNELAAIYVSRGVSPWLAKKVAEELTAKDVIHAHAKDELGIDLDAPTSPLQASLVGMISFFVGGGIPLVASAFIADQHRRLISLSVTSTFAMAALGIIAAVLGGANAFRGGCRVVVGGWTAMGVTYGIGRAFGSRARAA